MFIMIHICTSKCSGVYYGSPKVVGVDCSGFISRTWGLDQHYGTTKLPKISKKLRSKNNLRAGDILNRKGRHVRLFYRRANNGWIYVYEATVGHGGKVVKRAYSPRDLKKYLPYRFKYVVEETRPLRLIIYGKRTLKSGASNTYRATVIKSNGRRQSVTHTVAWSENSPDAYFEGAQLHARPVSKNKTFSIKATYTEKGQTLKAGVRITLLRSEQPVVPLEQSPVVVTSPVKSIPLKVDIGWVYRSNEGQSQPETLTRQTELHSGDHYKIIFAPAQKTYVYLFQQDASGNIEQLFPRQGSADNQNPTRPKETYFVPGQSQWFFLDNTTGTERFYFLVSEQADKLLEDQYQQVVNARQQQEAQKIRKTQKRLEAMIQARLKSGDKGSGGIISGPLQGNFTWKEYGQWFTTQRKQIKIKGGELWRFKHR